MKLFSLFAVILGTLAVEAHYAKDHKPQNIKFYELKKGSLVVNFTNFGARIVSLNVSDKFGNASDIVLGYDSIDAYQKDKYSLGAIVGRFASKFTLDKTEYELNINDGMNTLNVNGGRIGFGNVIWKVSKYDKSEKNPRITFQYDSYNNEQGFPVKLNVSATYVLQGRNSLKLTLYAEAKDGATPINLAQNTCWNLGGHSSPGNILHDQLRVFASSYTELDRNLIPTGKILPVMGTPYDFQRFHTIQSRFQKLKNGYEVSYVLDQQKKNEDDKDVKLAAVLRDNESGRVLKVWTDQPVVQFSTADKLKNVKGKGGVLYQRNAGVLLAAQGYADSVNVKNFPSKIVTENQPHKQKTVFQFSINK